jgi:hypothetical protein
MTGMSDQVQFVRLVQSFTDPVVWPLAHVLGGSFHLIGALTAADISAVLLVLLVWHRLVSSLVGTPKAAGRHDFRGYAVIV